MSIQNPLPIKKKKKGNVTSPYYHVLAVMMRVNKETCKLAQKKENKYCAVAFHVHPVSTFTSFLLWNCLFIAPACKTSWLNEESKNTVASKYWSLSFIPILHHPFSTPKLRWLTFPRGIDGLRQGYRVQYQKWI